jgi:hypothetical protein
VTIEAYVFVSTTNPGPRAAVRAIRSMDGIVRADALFGGPPVVVIVQSDDLLTLDAIIDRIVELPMVTDTETHVVRHIQGGYGLQRHQGTTAGLDRHDVPCAASSGSSEARPARSGASESAGNGRRSIPGGDRG